MDDDKEDHDNAVDIAVGRRVRAARLLVDMTQPELAAATGLKSYQQIQKYENGEVEITLRRLKLIAKALNVTLKYLVDEADHDGNGVATMIADKEIADHVRNFCDVRSERTFANAIALITKTAADFIKRNQNNGQDQG